MKPWEIIFFCKRDSKVQFDAEYNGPTNVVNSSVKVPILAQNWPLDQGSLGN